MNEQALAVQPSNIIQKGDNIIQKGDNLEVSAETPDEMKQSNHALIEWCDYKIKSLRVDHIELETSWKSAKEKKWKWTVLKRHADMAKKRIIFYGKLRAALKEGFYIVPNFPVTVFAMRTTEVSPLRMFTTVRDEDRPHPWKEQQSKSLPQGSGNYVSPNPEVACQHERNITEPSGYKTNEWSSWATAWKDVEFPICMSKPRIMEAVGRSMEIKLFDDLGVFSDAAIGRRGCGDPIIIGRLRDPRSTTYHQKFVSFIIAWHLNTESL